MYVSRKGILWEECNNFWSDWNPLQVPCPRMLGSLVPALFKHFSFSYHAIPFQVLKLTQRAKGLSINVKTNVNKIIADAFSGVGLHHGICFRDQDCRRVYRRVEQCQ